MSIVYTLGVTQARAHRFDITIEIESPEPTGQRLMLPAWIPGSYLVRDFARFVGRVVASDARGPVHIDKTSKHAWRCAPARGPLRVSYDVYAWDQSVRGAHLDDTHGFCNGVNVFMAVVGQEASPVGIELCQPESGSPASNWRVATTLTRAGAEPWGFGHYAAADYDELVDHPIEMGHFDVVTSEVAGVPHRVVLSGRHRCDDERLSRDVARICSEHVRLFGELPRMDEYLFLTRVLTDGYGGLEHRSSSALMCGRDQLPSVDATTNKRYQSLLGLISHEYFHLWNVKRIKPAAFTPYRLEQESYTQLLWVFEGITSYYDDLALVRSGAVSVADYLRMLGDTVTRVLSVPGHRWQTLAESSFDTWVKFYKPTPDTANSVVSYYAKGALVALALDLTLRERTAGKTSLDDVMRELWERYGKTGRGVPEDGFEALCEHVANLELTPFFDAAVRSTEPLDLAAVLETCGITLSSSVRSGAAPVSLGVVFEKDQTRLRQVMRGSAAERAGLAPGDELVALDGLRVASSDLAAALAGRVAGDAVDLHVFRDDELLARRVELDAAPMATWTAALADEASSLQLERRAHWLHRES